MNSSWAKKQNENVNENGTRKVPHPSERQIDHSNHPVGKPNGSPNHLKPGAKAPRKNVEEDLSEDREPNGIFGRQGTTKLKLRAL